MDVSSSQYYKSMLAPSHIIDVSIMFVFTGLLRNDEHYILVMFVPEFGYEC
jgi:hypothetical protein